MSMYSSVEQFSAGGVVFRAKATGYEVCLIRRQRYNNSIWCLPKGHLEHGETERTAAVREVKEETGIAGEITSELGTIHYQFTLPGERVRYDKSVTFFLMRTEEDTLDPQDTHEVVEARWFGLEEALQHDAYENERRILEKAREILYVL